MHSNCNTSKLSIIDRHRGLSVNKISSPVRVLTEPHVRTVKLGFHDCWVFNGQKCFRIIKLRKKITCGKDLFLKMCFTSIYYIWTWRGAHLLHRKQKRSFGALYKYVLPEASIGKWVAHFSLISAHAQQDQIHNGIGDCTTWPQSINHL